MILHNNGLYDQLKGCAPADNSGTSPAKQVPSVLHNPGCTALKGRRSRPPQARSVRHGQRDGIHRGELRGGSEGPCRQLGPTIEQLAGEYAGKAKVGKVNVDDHGDLAAQFGIRGIPTVLLFKGGKQVGSFVGLKPKDELAKAIDAAL